MKTVFKRFACTAALIPLAFCAPLPIAPVAVAQTVAVPTVEVADANPALWAVKDEDTTIYLFGTVHLLKPGLGWFDQAVKEAFDKSDKLVIEAILPEDPDEMVAKTVPLALDPTGTSLSSLLTEGQRAAYEAAMNKYGLPVGAFDVFKPWFPALTLASVILVNEGYSPDHGVEKILSTAAKATGKPIAALETFEEQMGFFDGLTREQQLRFLNDTVEQAPRAAPEFSEILFAWARGNPEELGIRMNRAMQGSEEIASVLLHQRNARWADWIKARLDQPGTIFVAVGAGHLSGSKSVQDYLSTLGIGTERIAY